jgi:hypothetical protein
MDHWWVIFDVGGVIVNDAFPECFRELCTSFPTQQHKTLLGLHSRNPDLWTRYRADPTYKEEDYWSELLQRGMNIKA